MRCLRETGQIIIQRDGRQSVAQIFRIRQQITRGSTVILDLIYQIIGTVKTLFGSNETDELYRQMLPLDIFVEVKDMRFQQHLAIIECRPCAYVCDTIDDIIRRIFASQDSYRVNPVPGH